MSKRNDILNATKSIIATEGVMNATIGHILKKAGTGYGTLYNYFDSKEKLYLELYIEIITGIETYIRSQINECMDVVESFKLILKHYVDYSLNHMEDFNALEALRFVPDVCGAAKKNGVGQVGLIELINQCEAQGVFRTRDPGYNAQLMIGMVSIFVRYYEDSQNKVTEAHKVDFVESCMKALG